jgi:hypothetical protein
LDQLQQSGVSDEAARIGRETISSRGSNNCPGGEVAQKWQALTL